MFKLPRLSGFYEEQSDTSFSLCNSHCSFTQREEENKTTVFMKVMVQVLVDEK